jgi:FixJ family two-component response regulator
MTIGMAPLFAVVDDVADLRMALTRLVSSAGFEAEAFESGSAFLQPLHEQTRNGRAGAPPL